MEALEVGRMAPMQTFFADATHTLWTYPCEAEREAPQANGSISYSHCMHDMPVHQGSPIGWYYALSGEGRQTPDP